MSNLNLLIVEGNDPKHNEFFVKAAKASCSENLKNLVLKLEPNSNIEIINPIRDDQTKIALENIKNYHGIIFTGGAMRLNDMTDEIKKHINFASNCFKYENKILAICWGLQVCSVAAGGKVAPGKKGVHIGIASDIEINDEGKKNPIYKKKLASKNTEQYSRVIKAETPLLFIEPSALYCFTDEYLKLVDDKKTAEKKPAEERRHRNAKIAERCEVALFRHPERNYEKQHGGAAESAHSDDPKDIRTAVYR